MFTCRRMKLYPYLEQIRSNYTKDLNLKSETLKLIEENIGSSPQDIGLGKDFLNKTPLTNDQGK